MALIKILIDTGSDSYSELDNLGNGKEYLPKVINYLEAINSGAKSAVVEVDLGSQKAVTSLTVEASGQQEDETFVVQGVTFTLKDDLGGAGHTGLLVEIDVLPEIMAQNIKDGIQSNLSNFALEGIVGVDVNGNVVSITADEGGKIGNAIVVTESVTQLSKAVGATGLDGTKYAISNG
jgi:hypothetical protein